MRIIQTFWTAGQDPLKESFGWAHSEYHLMSWALSCLNLREHYDEVELYTDSTGYHILIEVLGLPYTTSHVVFDDFKCLSQHWALSKIKTYSLQTEPFIHVDGDVFITKPLPKEIEKATLVAQNKERSTDYYQKMIDKILSVKTLHIEEEVLSQIKDGDIPSYNMGVFGGHDLNFIHEYCDKVFHFMDTNQMNDLESANSSTGCNVFFEQIFFAIYAGLMNKTVTPLIPRLIDDNGYIHKDFSNLAEYYSSSYFHLLGGHKRRKDVNSFLKKILLLKDASLYKKFIPLFPERHIQKFEIPSVENALSVERSIAQYDEFKERCLQKWNGLSLGNVVETEVSAASYLYYKNKSYSEKKELLLKGNPYLEKFTIPCNWHPKAIEILKTKYRCEQFFPLKDIAMIPSTNDTGIYEVPLTDLESDVVSLMQDQIITFEEVLRRLMTTYRLSENQVRKGLFINVVEQILAQGIILTHAADYNQQK